MAINIIVNGHKGKMGQEAVRAIEAAPDLHLVGTADAGDDIVALIKAKKAQVVLDFTRADAVYNNSKLIISAGAHPVIGTTGLTVEHIQELKIACNAKKLGGLIIPNFSIGAVLMMKYAQDAARYFSDVEIIELHHNQKQDSPSGTAMRTAAMIAENRNTKNKASEIETKEIIPGARGALAYDIPIHSVRLSGLVAHQEVIFGGEGETLILRHDSIHRQSFMPGVCLACKKVVELDNLLEGLESILN
jgi:4-hydroxy-tetrahydrodipicolinate reductase